MGKISSYPSDANVTTSDRLIGSDNENSNETKNFEVGDIINLASTIIIPQIGNSFIPYTGATNDVDLGAFALTTSYLTSNLGIFIDGSNGAISLDGNEGNTSDVLVSQGPGATPTWSNALSQFVPYTGATGNVDLGIYSLTSPNLICSEITPNNGYVFLGYNFNGAASGIYVPSGDTTIIGDVIANANNTTITIDDFNQKISFIGGFNLSNGEGTVGQVLTSAGAGTTPTWTSLPSLTGFVPYTGATANVDLGGQTLTTSYLTSSLGILIDGNIAAISLDGDEGNLGEVMISTGPSSTPVWTDINGLITSNLYKGNFYDSITQTLAAPNTATPVILRNTDAPTTNGISIVTDGTNLSRITFAHAGVYNILFSAQLANSGGTGQTVDFWLRKNGSTFAANIAHTNGKVQLQGNASFLMAAWNYFVDVAAGDYIQLVWAATSTNVTMVAAAANGVHPETPSIIVTANVV
jgi:hypothetical protein